MGMKFRALRARRKLHSVSSQEETETAHRPCQARIWPDLAPHLPVEPRMAAVYFRWNNTALVFLISSSQPLTSNFALLFIQIKACQAALRRLAFRLF